MLLEVYLVLRGSQNYSPTNVLQSISVYYRLFDKEMDNHVPMEQ